MREKEYPSLVSIRNSIIVLCPTHKKYHATKTTLYNSFYDYVISCGTSYTWHIRGEN